MTEIDEKQRAINELKANLLDDLSERGVMSDIEAEQCLEEHKAQQEKLTNKLNNERDKQERVSLLVIWYSYMVQWAVLCVAVGSTIWCSRQYYVVQ